MMALARRIAAMFRTGGADGYIVRFRGILRGDLR